MFDLISKRNWFFAFSLLITIPGLIFILLTPITGGKDGLKFSIDYTGGTEWTIKFKNPDVTADQVRSALADLGQPESTVTRTGSGFLEIRLTKLDLREQAPLPSAAPSTSPGAGSPGASASAGASATPSPTPSPSPSPTPSPTAATSASPGASPSASEPPVSNNTEIPRTGPLGEIVTGLEARFGPIDQQLSLSSIGAIVSSDLIQQAVVLIFVGALGILGWITLRFRDVKFGVTALVALLHDVIVVIGIFAILGTLFDVQIDGLFVTAMLTVIGFSVHDTIVVFDRIRENRARHAGEPFAEIVNHSLLQTFGRSITTSFTVVLTLTALLLFGGSATQEFVLALLIGIVSGTYSSIFNASPLLVVWTEWEEQRKGRVAPPRATRPASA
ncbi:MAG TPA: protein translocase subunit SecF [Candidatus Limnocylindrales bacterium]